MSTTKIPWVAGPDGRPGRSWNPFLGCDRVSDGCDNCYAIVQATIRAGNPNPKIAAAFAGLTERVDGRRDWTGQVNLLEARLAEPLKVRKPTHWFVNSLSDLFHEGVPDEFVARVFAVMAASPQHTYRVLTKRHGRMRSLLSGGPRDAWLVPRHPSPFVQAVHRELRNLSPAGPLVPWPLQNVWLGVSAEDQHWADIRIHALLATPAYVHWVSLEPQLGRIDLRNLHARNGALIDALCGDVKSPAGEIYAACPSALDWVVSGGESGPRARRMDPDWARSLRDQCSAAGTSYYFKQAGRVLAAEWGCADAKGENPDEWPEPFPRDFPAAWLMAGAR